MIAEIHEKRADRSAAEAQKWEERSQEYWKGLVQLNEKTASQENTILDLKKLTGGDGELSAETGEENHGAGTGGLKAVADKNDRPRGRDSFPQRKRRVTPSQRHLHGGVVKMPKTI